MIYVRGADSAIAKALAILHPIYAVKRGAPMPAGKLYLFCVGLNRPLRLVSQTRHEVAETFWVNAGQVIAECDKLIETNPMARICVVGSDSGFKWSFDGAYAAAKAGLHRYVETKRLNWPEQQLVCVAPSMVLRTGMNKRRNADGAAAAEKRRLAHPKQRWLHPFEVARLIHFLLCVDEGYTSGVVIRMNGGEHCVSQ